MDLSEKYLGTYCKCEEFFFNWISLLSSDTTASEFGMGDHSLASPSVLIIPGNRLQVTEGYMPRKITTNYPNIQQVVE